MHETRWYSTLTQPACTDGHRSMACFTPPHIDNVIRTWKKLSGVVGPWLTGKGLLPSARGGEGRH